jgi:hypothetical protein
MAAQPEFSQIAPNFGQRCQEPRRLSTSKTRGHLRIESPTPMGNTLRADNLPWGSRKQHTRPLSLPPLKRQHITTASKPYTNFSLERELGRRPRRAASQSDNESMEARMSVSRSMGSSVDLDALSVEVCHPAFYIKILALILILARTWMKLAEIKTNLSRRGLICLRVSFTFTFRDIDLILT